MKQENLAPKIVRHKQREILVAIVQATQNCERPTNCEYGTQRRNFTKQAKEVLHNKKLFVAISPTEVMSSRTQDSYNFIGRKSFHQRTTRIRDWTSPLLMRHRKTQNSFDEEFRSHDKLNLLKISNRRVLTQVMRKLKRSNQ